MKIVKVVATVAALAGIGAVQNVAVARPLAPNLQGFASLLAAQYAVPNYQALADVCNSSRQMSANVAAQVCE
jgi:hypothetical protein